MTLGKSNDMGQFKATLRRLSSYRLGQLASYAPRTANLLAKQSHPYLSGLRFSIVTPVRNQACFIAKTIESVVNQHFSPLEYIVMDGGSDDGTTHIVEQYVGHLHHFESQKDDGQSDALNKGFVHATGEILGWLNGDDILLPGTLEFVARFFEAHPDIDVIYGDRLLIDSNGDEIGRWLLPSHSDRILSWVDYVPQETLFWRRTLWERVGCHFDASYHFAMDWDLLVRFRDAGARFHHVPRLLGAFRVHAAQKTSSHMVDMGSEEMQRIRTRCLGYPPSKASQRAAITPYVLRHIARVWQAKFFNLLGRADE